MEYKLKSCNVRQKEVLKTDTYAVEMHFLGSYKKKIRSKGVGTKRRKYGITVEQIAFIYKINQHITYRRHVPPPHCHALCTEARDC
jgi:hypothetical protein